MILNMTELQKKIQSLIISVVTVDRFSKPVYCNELLGIIKGVTNLEEQAGLYCQIAPVLVDMKMDQELQQCIDSLKSNTEDYRASLSACFIKRLWCRRVGDNNGCISAITEGIEISEKNGDSTALAQGLTMRGKAYMKAERYDDALVDFNKSILLAEDTHNFNQLAINKYFIGLVLFAKGHNELGFEKLREASEMAHEQKCADIIKHTEAVRALKMLECGKVDAARLILSKWFTEFGADLCE